MKRISDNAHYELSWYGWSRAANKELKCVRRYHLTPKGREQMRRDMTQFLLDFDKHSIDTKVVKKTTVRLKEAIL